MLALRAHAVAVLVLTLLRGYHRARPLKIQDSWCSNKHHQQRRRIGLVLVVISKPRHEYRVEARSGTRLRSQSIHRLPLLMFQQVLPVVRPVVPELQVAQALLRVQLH